MSRYLVTGGAGFIGSHITDRLLAQGHQVRVLDDLSSGKEANLPKGKVEFVKADLRDRALMDQAVQGVDYILHVAAWRSVPKSMADAYGYMDVNVMGTTNVLEAAVKHKVKRVVVVSSSSVYGETSKVPMSETDPTNPVSPYAASKLIDEILCGMYYRAYKLETVAVRYFNVFGPRQSLENDYAVVIPKFIVSLLKRESPPVFGDGKQSRDFTYVDNVADATIKASTAPHVGDGQVFNIALGEEHSLLDLLERLNKILGTNVAPTFKPKRTGDVYRTFADSRKAEKLLGWKGSVNFEEGLRRTVEWFQAHPA